MGAAYYTIFRHLNKDQWWKLEQTTAVPPKLCFDANSQFGCNTNTGQQGLATRNVWLKHTRSMQKLLTSVVISQNIFSTSDFTVIGQI